MGQYHLICNLDKREFLNPHQFGDGLKLMEFGDSTEGTLLALAVLLAGSNGRGGGDFQGEGAGNWAGDRIAIIGDYYEASDAGYRDGIVNLHLDDYDDLWQDEPTTWTDISPMVRAALELSGERRRRLPEWSPYRVQEAS